MKKLLSLFLAALLLCSACSAAFAEGFDAAAFAEKFDRQSLKIEPVTLPGAPEQVTWLTGSPSGRYFVGLTDTALIVYDRQSQAFSPINIDWSSDANGKLAKLFSKPEWLLAFHFVWSPDERYFTASSLELTISNNMLVCDLMLCNTETMTLRIVQSWGLKAKDENSGSVFNTCFSPDGKTLYFGFFGNAYAQQFGSKYLTLAYDIAAGTVSYVTSNQYKDDQGVQKDGVFHTMACLEDGSLVQLLYNRKKPMDLYLRHLTPSAQGWDESLLLLPYQRSMATPYLLCTATGSRVLVRFDLSTAYTGTIDKAKNTADAMLGAAAQRSTPEPLVMEAVLDSNKNLVPGANFTGTKNACLSPDSRYILLLTGQYNQWGLTVYDTLTGKPCFADISTLQENTDFAYIYGRNALAKQFPTGMMWCGDLLLIGTDEGAKPFRFAD